MKMRRFVPGDTAETSQFVDGAPSPNPAWLSRPGPNIEITDTNEPEGEA